MLLTEQVDRLSRLNAADWRALQIRITGRGVRVVALDLPTSWIFAEKRDADDITGRIFSAMNVMLLDVLAAVARKDYEDRRRRQAQGIAKAKKAGAYRGRPEDEKRNAAIVGMLDAGQTWAAIVAATGCSRSTLSRLAKRAGSMAPASAG
ncbi:DNA invertase Pin-like site-specific DNA recombinase [Rhodoblastus acidophilus]|nr:DNA invertase Pin-like site-specific DNA recombinase [Rhodoblastus acidophilus]